MIDNDAIPKWAKLFRYEYDLGMSTSCSNCEKRLVEGRMVLEDSEDKGTFYCSPECTWEADAEFEAEKGDK